MKDTAENIIGIEDAVLTNVDGIVDDGVQQQSSVYDEGNKLWLYHNQNKINGVAVDPAFCKLPIDKDEVLDAAFVLDRRPRSLVFYISPENESKDYQELLDKIYNGQAELLDETKQFDAQGCRFIVWIRYNELKYVLNPRFNYLCEDK